MFDWSAEQYKKFERQRTMPAIDLANAIQIDKAEKIIDIGCGIGNSTSVLRRKFPQSVIIGADNSEDMLASARINNPGIEFINLNAETDLNRVTEKFDIVFSNACIQWIPEHKRLLKSMIHLLNDGGVMAIQIPRQDKQPFHKIIKDIAKKWNKKIIYSNKLNILSEEEYFDILSDISNDFQLWETVYFHAMPSHQSIVEWYKGTALRPYINQLADADRKEFENDILKETERVFPVQNNGEIIFKFPRLFMTAKNL